MKKCRNGEKNKMGSFAGYYGNMTIPEEKREEFTKRVLKILEQGGMIQFKKVQIYGSELFLMHPPVLDKKGEIRFDYNYFEDKSWETAGYDSKNADFWTNKVGDYEFAWVVIAIYILYEFYTETFGMAEFNGELVDGTIFIGWLNYLFGEKYTNQRAVDIWKVTELLHKNDWESVDFWFDLWRLQESINKENISKNGIIKYYYIEKGKDALEKYKENWFVSKIFELIEIVNTIKDSTSQNEQEGLDILKEILLKSMDEKGEIVEHNNDIYAEYACLSILPAEVVTKAIADAYQLDYWKLWNEIEKQLTENMDFFYDGKEEELLPIHPIATKDFLYVSDESPCFWHAECKEGEKNYHMSDDDRAYYWKKNGDVYFSKEMKFWLKQQKSEYEKILQKDSYILSEIEFLKKLIEVLKKADALYKRIYAFQEMFYDFQENYVNKEYQAALLLLEKMVNEYAEEGKIISKVGYDWDLTDRNITFNNGRVAIKRILAVMANRTLRKLVFNF